MAFSTVEVAMRPPEVFVRPLLHEEAVRLKGCRSVRSISDAPAGGGVAGV